MPSRNFIIGLAASAALAAVGVVLFAGEEAQADRVIVISAAKARLTHGSWGRMDDGGFGARACGDAEKADGGAAPLAEECVRCESPNWGGLPAACIAAWKAANTD